VLVQWTASPTQPLPTWTLAYFPHSTSPWRFSRSRFCVLPHKSTQRAQERCSGPGQSNSTGLCFALHMRSEHPWWRISRITFRHAAGSISSIHWRLGNWPTTTTMDPMNLQSFSEPCASPTPFSIFNISRNMYRRHLICRCRSRVHAPDSAGLLVPSHYLRYKRVDLSDYECYGLVMQGVTKSVSAPRLAYRKLIDVALLRSFHVDEDLVDAQTTCETTLRSGAIPNPSHKLSLFAYPIEDRGCRHSVISETAASAGDTISEAQTLRCRDCIKRNKRILAPADIGGDNRIGGVSLSHTSGWIYSFNNTRRNSRPHMDWPGPKREKPPILYPLNIKRSCPRSDCDVADSISIGQSINNHPGRQASLPDGC